VLKTFVGIILHPFSDLGFLEQRLRLFAFSLFGSPQALSLQSNPVSDKDARHVFLAQIQ
jgi:hypothetical protein